MSTLSILFDKYHVKGYLEEEIKKSNIEPQNIETIKALKANRQSTLLLLKKDDEYRDMLNGILGTKYRSVLRSKRNMEEPIASGELPLEGDIIVLKDDNTWFTINTSEWGSLNTL